MNSLTVAVVAVIWFIIGYAMYGRWVDRRLATPDDARPTPAHEQADGVDYAASKRRMLWGNHFASIAGAGPIIGPILATSIFGWGPTLIWVLVGSLFIGAIHDYMALMLSLQNKGEEMAQLAREYLGPSVRRPFALLLYFMLMLLVAVFMVSVAEALVNMPALVIPTFGLVGIAVIMGVAVYGFGVNDILATVLGVVSIYALIYVGWKHPISLPASLSKEHVIGIWLAILSAYCLIASLAPMQYLLRPRDVISSVKLWIGMLLGLLGLFVARPPIDAPAFVGDFVSHGKPLWPMLFIMVACGAVSGFHSLVSTGTTARQLDKESDAKGVAFGGMLSEGLLAVLVLLVVSAGLKWGMAPEGTARAAERYFGDALAQNWIIAFSNGFGNIVHGTGIAFLTVPLAALVGAVMVKSFILTTLDVGTRLSRYLIEENFGDAAPILRNKTVASLSVLVPAFLLAYAHAYGNVWKLFGAVNQLVAAVVLCCITVYLSQENKPRMPALIPAVFMLATTGAALLWEMFAPGTGYFTSAEPNYSLGVLAGVLLMLGLTAAFQARRAFAGGPKYGSK